MFVKEERIGSSHILREACSTKDQERPYQLHQDQVPDVHCQSTSWRPSRSWIPPECGDPTPRREFRHISAPPNAVLGIRAECTKLLFKRDRKSTSQDKIRVSVAIKQATLGLERVESSQGRRGCTQETVHCGWEEPTDAIEVSQD